MMSITENESTTIRDCIQQLKDCAEFITKSVEEVENEIKDLTITSATPPLTDKKEHTKEYDKIRKLLKKVSKECKQKIHILAKSIKDSDDNIIETSSVAEDDTADDQTVSDPVPVSAVEVNKKANSESTVTVNGDKVNGHEEPKENGNVTPDSQISPTEETTKSSESEVPPSENANPPNPPSEDKDTKPLIVEAKQEVRTKIRLVAIEKLLDPKVMASSAANSMPFRPRPVSPPYISPNIQLNTSSSIIILDSDDDTPPAPSPAKQTTNNALNGAKNSEPVAKPAEPSQPITNGEKEGPTSKSMPKVVPLKIRINRCKVSESLVKAGKRVIKISEVPSLARAASTDSSEDSAAIRKRRRRRSTEKKSSSSSDDSDLDLKRRKKGKYEQDSAWEGQVRMSSRPSRRSKRRREERRRRERRRETRRHKSSASSRDKSKSHSSRHRSKIIDSESESDKNSDKENNDLDDIEAQLQQMESNTGKDGEKASRKNKASKSSSNSKHDNEKSNSDIEKSTAKADKDKSKSDESSSDETIVNMKEKVVGKSSKDGKTKEKAKEDSEKKSDDEGSDKDKDDNNSGSSSDEEIVKTRKTNSKRKRRIRTSSTSASDDNNRSEDERSSDDDDSDDVKSKRKGKREKNKKSKDDESDSDTDTPGKRKNIRKILKTNKLDESTIKATEAEKERRRRIEERQKLYNQIFEKPESTEVDKVVLDFDPETKEELLTIDKGLIKKLKPHQVQGVKFMWDACFETMEDIDTKPGSGCILGHCMGLGKTLQVVTLSHTLLANSEKTHISTVLVITPLSTVTNWAREFHMWIKFCKYKDIEIYDMSKYKDKKLRAYKLSEWQEDGGVCILGYDMYRILSNPKIAGGKKIREQLQKALVDPGPDLIVCDEGHLLKNEKTSISKAVNQVRTLRRIVLSGTPLQNNLKEYYCMVQFVKPNLLGTYKEYLNRFVNPITNGQYTDSTERDTRLMKNRSHVLHKMLEGCIQRRDYSVLAPYLPPKHEYVVFIALSELQTKLYEHYMTNERSVDPGNAGKGTALFKDFQNLRRIWTHPMALRVNSDEVKKKRERKAMMQEEEDSMDDFIDDEGSTESESEASSSDSGGSDSSGKAKKKKSKAENSSRKTRNNPTASAPDLIEDEEEQPCASEWWKTLCNESDLKNLHHSPKLFLLFEILQECETLGDKILLFSQSLQSLDVIESFLSLIDKKTQGVEHDCGDVNGFIGSWKLGLDYFRLDGSNSVESRELMCKRFNNPRDFRSRLFLISTRAGSLGINLVAANRVIIFDASWNPSHDTQSIFRVYRFGQDKPCYIYRFIAKGTMEEKIYERQVMKQATAKRVIDEHQIGRHYNSNDLMELYQYDLSVPEVREVPILPKDRLFAEIIKKHEKFIYKYHEHDSLLENKESENLNEEERKAAWAEFENEKNQPASSQLTYAKPNYRNGPVTSSKIFGFRSDVLLRLLNLKVRRDNPHLTDMEVGQYVPLYLRQLYEEMNSGILTLFTELNEMNRAFEMPTGYGVNPMNPNYIVNPFYQPPATQNTEPAYIHEID